VFLPTCLHYLYFVNANIVFSRAQES